MENPERDVAEKERREKDSDSDTENREDGVTTPTTGSSEGRH